jgi:hypothetical protein
MLNREAINKEFESSFAKKAEINVIKIMDNNRTIPSMAKTRLDLFIVQFLSK